jgi:preprotein translocase subunit SecG
MSFVIGILTVLLVLNCLLLILLVLIQLPKKDAGAGMAFGGGAADALFGAGSGNALTKITKYARAAR